MEILSRLKRCGIVRQGLYKNISLERYLNAKPVKYLSTTPFSLYYPHMTPMPYIWTSISLFSILIINTVDVVYKDQIKKAVCCSSAIDTSF